MKGNSNSPKKFKSRSIHLILFIITLVTTTAAGAEWSFAGSFLPLSVQKFLLLNLNPVNISLEEADRVLKGYEPMNFHDFLGGLYFSIPFLTILTVHEFGHYFTAKYYKLKVSLPYYIPLWFPAPLFTSIGTMGAVIKIKSMMQSRKQFFDVGYAGPLAGFIVALIVLFYGFTHLPPPEQIFDIHPEYSKYGLDYAQYVYKNQEFSMKLGSNLLFMFFENFVASDHSLIPNAYEMMHYPFLFAGFLACFFTALNLIPIGQLDGGHILYGLIGIKNHSIASPILFGIFIYIGGLGLFSLHDPTEYLIRWIPVYLFFLYFIFQKVGRTRLEALLIAMIIFTLQFLSKSYFPSVQGFYGWLVFGALIGRVLGVYHPPALYDEPLDNKRKVIGWISLFIFVITFSPTPFVMG